MNKTGSKNMMNDFEKVLLDGKRQISIVCQNFLWQSAEDLEGNITYLCSISKSVRTEMF